MKTAICTFNTFGQHDLTLTFDYSDAVGPVTTGVTFSLPGWNNQTYRFPYSGQHTMNSLFGPFNLTATDPRHPATNVQTQTIDASDRPGPFLHFTATYQKDNTGIEMICTSVTYTALGAHPVPQTLNFNISPQDAAEIAAVADYISNPTLRSR